MRVAFEGVSFSYGDRKPLQRTDGVADTSQEDARIAWGVTPDDCWALDQVSFCLEPGDCLGVAGHTGSGKSTLAQMLAGLLAPTAGKITLDDAKLSGKVLRKELKRKTGVVFQYPERQLFASTVFEDVAFGPKNQGLRGEALAQRVREALSLVGLSGESIGERNPFELSGGRRRAVALAGVLALKPEILILDEPAAGLDPQAKNNMLNLIASLREKGMTVVMVSHLMEDLASLCNRILVLNRGRVFACDTPQRIFSGNLDLRSIGLDVPAAQRMALELRACGFCLPGYYHDADTLADALAQKLALGDFGCSGSKESSLLGRDPFRRDESLESDGEMA